MDLVLCPYCQEKIQPGLPRCPACGEVLGAKPLREPTGWGSPLKPWPAAIFGWLNLIFGGLGVLGLVMNVALVAFMGTNNMIMNSAFGPPGSGQRTFMLVATLLGGVVCVLYLVGGYGLLMLRGWGRRLAVGTFVFGVLQAVVGPMFSIPLTLQNAQPGTETIVLASGVAGAVFGLIYPVLGLVFLTRPHVKAAFDHWDARDKA